MAKIVLIIHAVSVLGLLGYFGCDKGTEPPKPLKNPREYNWTVDTLIAHPDAIQTEMRDIYATSPQNVYVAGHTDWTGMNGNGILWRYDGEKWSIINQGFKDVSLVSVTGFGSSDIFAAGSKGLSALILHFDGVGWTQTILPSQPLFAIRGSSRSAIWAGGWEGAAFHFDGTQWLKVPLDEKLSIRYLAVMDGATYATAYRVGEQFPADSIAWFFLRWNTSTWDTLDMFVQITGQPTKQTFGSALSVVRGELYSGGGRVFKFVAGKWEEIFSGPNAGPVAGPSEDNLFSVGFNGAVYHYNGKDWYQFKQFQSSEYSFGAVWFDGKEVFIVGNNGRKTLVLHGK